MINDMWTTTSNKIKDVPLDTHNVSTSLYRQMLKELLPELSQSTNYSSVQETLMYPVITDELNLIIRKSNDTGTVHELTDKIFDKLVSLLSYINTLPLRYNYKKNKVLAPLICVLFVISSCRRHLSGKVC